MKLSKKLAKDFRTGRNLLVERVDEETFWVSDTHIVVKLGLDDFIEFREKWNNYKSTVNIPEVSQGVKIVNGELSKYEGSVMAHVIENNLDYKLKITEEVTAKVGKLGVRKLVSNDIGGVYMAQEFEYLITEFEGCELYISGKFGAIHVLLDDDLKALIMPVRGFENE
jgi:hypothetical protein